MNPSIHTEVNEHLRHKDYSLVLRRMLDLSYDTGNLSIIREATAWSRKWNSINSQQATEPGEQFFTDINQLLEKADAALKREEQNHIMLLDAVNISKTYNKGNFTLNPVNISIQNGDILGVVGENGNGKTTLLRCLAGQLYPDSGTVHYSLLSNPDYYNIKNYVAFIPQRIPRWYGMLKDNLHFSASIAGMYGETNETMVEFMLERLNLTQYAYLNWNQISSGYRTRFELARILLQKPQLLILDEPLANLDIKAQQTILTDLRYMTAWRNHPMGIVLSSQQLHEVEKIAHSVMMIKNGTCIHHSFTNEDALKGNAVEVETTTDKETLQRVFAESTTSIQFNGGFYTITSESISAQQMIELLVKNNVTITYFRDITHSTKRYF
ncbi:MAG: ABC transporter ATP-binding protein [Lacibacter sp.]